MKKNELIKQIKKKKSFLCVGLDTDVSKIPKHLLTSIDPQFEFNKGIIEATVGCSIAFKPNLAFYECYGKRGWESLERTAWYIKEKYPDIFLIADAKRGDIGNTSKMYAEAFFKNLPFDAITVAPYMGEDSVTPFLEFSDKWAIILALTSNKGSYDFQHTVEFGTTTALYQKVLIKSQKWGNNENIMYVVGATQAEELTQIRKIVPNHFLLIPGVGAQGGSLEEVAKYGLTNECGLIVNNSRAIIYASDGENFDDAAAIEARKMQNQMHDILKENSIC